MYPLLTTAVSCLLTQVSLANGAPLDSLNVTVVAADPYAPACDGESTAKACKCGTTNISFNHNNTTWPTFPPISPLNLLGTSRREKRCRTELNTCPAHY